MQEYTNNPFVGNKVIQELKIGTRKNMSYDPLTNPIQLIQQLENMDYLAYDIVEKLKDKEPVVRQILKEQNDIDYLMDMHQEYYTNENKRENSLVYKLQNQYLSDIETQRIISNIPVCPGNIIELDTNEHQMLQLSPVMYLISVNWATTNQNIVKEYFHRWVPIVPYNANLYVAMYSPNTSKIQENKTIHQKQFLNVYNHRYVHNYKYAHILKQLPRIKVYLTYNGQLYKLECDTNIDSTQNNTDKILSKLVKDFTNVSANMLPIEEYYAKIYPALKTALSEFLVERCQQWNQITNTNTINDLLNEYIDVIESTFNSVDFVCSQDKKYHLINAKEVCSAIFDDLNALTQNALIQNDTTNQNAQYLYKIVDNTLHTMQFDFDYDLLDTQKEYFYTNQDYMFCIKQYQFSNQSGNVFRIVAPMNNIVSNVYVYSVVEK